MRSFDQQGRDKDEATLLVDDKRDSSSQNEREIRGGSYPGGGGGTSGESRGVLPFPQPTDTRQYILYEEFLSLHCAKLYSQKELTAKRKKRLPCDL